MGNRTKTATRIERPDRVRAHTRPELNERIDEETAMRLQYYASQGGEVIERRLEELEAEPDIEQVLQANAASLSVLGASLGLFSSRKWLILPVAVGAFLFQHAVKGWCPPLPVMRRLGVRTRKEIERERCALMALRGDFSDIETGDNPQEQTARVLARFGSETR